MKTMRTVDVSDMKRHLMRLALHFPQAQRTDVQLNVLAEDYARALACYPPEVVQTARERIQENERFFPCIAVFRDYCCTVATERRREREALEREAFSMSEAQWERNRHILSVVRAHLRGDAGASAELDRLLNRCTPKEQEGTAPGSGLEDDKGVRHAI